MLEKYLMTPDGEEYVDVNNVREALGIKEDDNIFAVIKKLREDNDLLEELHATHVDQLKEYAELAFELGIESGDAESIKDYIISLKKERDELKEKCDKLKTRANAMYGTSCGYSASDQPAFRCNVISYSLEFSPIVAHSLMDEPSYWLNNGSIHVELDLTPNANYKGTFGMEDLKRYIEEYGREKRLGVLESVDYKNAKVARAELAFLYKTVLGKDRLDTNLSPHEITKAILDEVKQLRDSLSAFSQSLRSVYMHIYEGTGYKASDIYADPDKIADWIITRHDSTRKLGKMETLCDKYNVVQPDRKSTTKERLDYIFSVLAENRKRYDSEWKWVEELKKGKRTVEDSRREFLRKLSYSLGIGDPVVNQDNIDQKEKDILEKIEGLKAGVWPCENSSAFAEYLRKEFPELCKEYNVAPLAEGGSVRDWLRYIFSVLAQYRDFAFSKKKYESLKKFRDDACKVFDISSSTADKQILKEIRGIADRYIELKYFRGDICGILDFDDTIGSPQQNDEYILEQIEKLNGDHCDAIVFRNDAAKAIGLSAKDCNSDIINRIMQTKKCLDKLARLRSNICSALCLGGETSDEDILKVIAEDRKKSNKLTVFRNDVAKAIGLPHVDIDSDIINRVMQTKECHDKLCKDYAKLHDDYVDSQKQVKGFTNRCDSLENLRRDLWEFRRNAIEDLKNRGFFFRPEENETLPEIYDKLLKRYDNYFSRYKEQYCLRQQWHVRWESENERANGVQKALDREREKCRVKDISLETAKKQYEKVCNNLETAECALNGMKSKVRELREEKNKVISAIGQDIWDDAVK